jgi:hypothetical protein
MQTLPGCSTVAVNNREKMSQPLFLEYVFSESKTNLLFDDAAAALDFDSV